MKKWLLTLFLFASFQPDLSSQVWGPGAGSCSQFLSHPANLQIDYFFWAQGFIGAVSFSQKRDITAGYSQENLQAWLKNYCQENPLKFYSDGVVELIENQLMKPTQKQETRPEVNFSAPFPR